MDNQELQNECLEYVSNSDNQPPTLHDVMTLYCGLSPGVEVKDLCMRYTDQISRVNVQ